MGHHFRSRDVCFPPSAERYCNMLPFVSHDNYSIPSEYHAYMPIIDRCRRLANISQHEHKIWYLTIHESQVAPSAFQRRPGIHTEGFLAAKASCKNVMQWHNWGFGRGQFDGGIYHASTVSDSCRMWNVLLPRESSAALAVGCDLDHLRGVLDEVALAVQPRANDIYWMTDATPHESLPLKEGTYRQYFRLVAGNVTAWWKKHSTVNRLGIQPDCDILTHSKFDEDALIGYDACTYQSNVS